MRKTERSGFSMGSDEAQCARRSEAPPFEVFQDGSSRSKIRLRIRGNAKFFYAW